jgi:hypothetical protein
LTNVLNDRKAPFDAALDAARWEAVGPEIVANLDDPDLKGRLASHFERVRALNSIYRMYLDTTIGVASTIIGSETTREALRNYLVTFTAELKADGGHLADEVEMVIGNLLSPQE